MKFIMKNDLGFLRKFKNQNKFYEIWWGKVEISQDQAFWWRYTILQGKKSEASTWGIFFDKNKFITGKDNFNLNNLSLSDSEIFKLNHNHLKLDQACGSAGKLNWNFSIKSLGKSHFFEPYYIQKLYLAKSHYDSSFMDLRISGVIHSSDKQIIIKNNPGVMGHIYGTKMADNWVWIHANHFDDDVVFECLCASIKFGSIKTPYLSQFVLYYKNEKIIFDSLSNLLFSKIDVQNNSFHFLTKNKKYALNGFVRAEKEKIAVVEYEDTDGSKLWCRNTKLGDLKLELRHRTSGEVKKIEAQSNVSFEVVDRHLRNEKVDL